MPGGPNTIAELWQLYETRVLPGDAGPVQRRDCRTAFYAAISFFIPMLLTALEEDETPEDDGWSWMNERIAELTEYRGAEILKMARPAGEG